MADPHTTERLIIPDGWQLVPIKSTTVMDNVGADALGINREQARRVYDAMLRDAPAHYLTVKGILKDA